MTKNKMVKKPNKRGVSRLGNGWWQPSEKLPQPGECVLILVGCIYITAWYYQDRHTGKLNWKSYNGYDCNTFPVRAWRRIPKLEMTHKR